VQKSSGKARIFGLLMPYSTLRGQRPGVLFEAKAVQSIHHGLFRPETAEPRTQYGALCWRMRRDNLQVLLVTSRDTGRWVIPKGWPHDNQDGANSAAREAWEEAGVEGAVDPRCLGVFAYDKVQPASANVPCVVGVYGLRVHRLLRRFPERDQRRRKWFSVEKAARRVAEPELRALMLAMRGVLPMPEPVSAVAVSVAPAAARP
jgi:8-oxo-dGTP pyrophosphatase MutT (NUDIX family)